LKEILNLKKLFDPNPSRFMETKDSRRDLAVDNAWIALTFFIVFCAKDF
jgi:hypothetical protein